MVSLNLPVADLNLRRIDDGAPEVFDSQRRRWVALTPEEWVRQHFVSMLVNARGYMAGRIANEVTITLNGMSRRCDSVVYDSSMTPLVIVEYKAPEVRITQAVFDQIARYASVLRAPYLMVSNGLTHYCCHIDYDSMRLEYLTDIPCYQDLIS
ncbi:MAG: type I restriction enzyme HsdR N-terminal domain-containing protein [Bacteroides sp.]|nr:type I restriction enzyme HsdR N-terminal domain-containing protein [Bacteroides sp.]MCM1413456.1 type I restriction enzyme HsdR N-terminal domain-containing protein [Bacteroides sp.]MCM1471333.1 type I restriction enzyme HsdR N-terminal domain-containing protein [Bacteroides sp.]